MNNKHPLFILANKIDWEMKERQYFRKRAGIEPVIGHLKEDYHLSCNYDKGIFIDEIYNASSRRIKLQKDDEQVEIFFLALFGKDVFVPEQKT